MRYFRHRRGRIVFECGGALLIGSAAAAGWIESGRMQLLLPAFAATLYGLCRAVMLLARNPALAYDAGGLQIGRLLLIHKYRWDQLRDIRVTHWRPSTLPIRLPSWIPHEREHLELLIGGASLASGSIKLRPENMELPADGVKQLVSMLQAAQVEALGERGAAIARLGVNSADYARVAVTGLHAERLRRLGLDAAAEPPPVRAQVSAPALPAARELPRSFGRRVR